MRSLTAVGLALGLGAGVAVTQRAHRAPISPWFEGRVGGTRLRRSDLHSLSRLYSTTPTQLHERLAAWGALADDAMPAGAGAGGASISALGAGGGRFGGRSASR